MAILSSEKLISSESPSRLSSAIDGERLPSFANLAPLPGNVEAVEAGLLFSRSLQSFVVIAGPSGQGKSEILSAAHYHSRSSKLMSADRFVSGKFASLSGESLVIDDCQAVIGKPRRMVAFRSALDRRIRSGLPTMLAFTCNSIDRRVMSVIPRAKRWAMYEIQTPDEQERAQIISHLARMERITLNSNLIKILSRWLPLSGREFSGAIARLKLESDSWLDQASILRACAILDPYFSDQPNWDLALRIAKIGKRLDVSESMICHVILRVAGVCEASAAAVLSLQPGQCYAHSVCFERVKRQEPEAASAEHRFLEAIVQSLLA